MQWKAYTRPAAVPFWPFMLSMALLQHKVNDFFFNCQSVFHILYPTVTFFSIPQTGKILFFASKPGK